MAYRGKFQGCIGRVAEYNVYLDKDVILLYKNKETTPCYEGTSYEAAERFAGVTGYRQTGRGLMPLYE